MRDNLGMKMAGWLFGALLACAPCMGQDLTPRAYVITPVHSNAIVLTDSFFSGNLMFNGAVPITRRQSLKLSYSRGTYIRFGANFHNLSVAWQYSWLWRPKW